MKNEKAEEENWGSCSVEVVENAAVDFCLRTWDFAFPVTCDLLFNLGPRHDSPIPLFWDHSFVEIKDQRSPLLKRRANSKSKHVVYKKSQFSSEMTGPNCDLELWLTEKVQVTGSYVSFLFPLPCYIRPRLAMASYSPLAPQRPEPWCLFTQRTFVLQKSKATWPEVTVVALTPFFLFVSVLRPVYFSIRSLTPLPFHTFHHAEEISVVPHELLELTAAHSFSSFPLPPPPPHPLLFSCRRKYNN